MTTKKTCEAYRSKNNHTGTDNFFQQKKSFHLIRKLPRQCIKCRPIKLHLRLQMNANRSPHNPAPIPSVGAFIISRSHQADRARIERGGGGAAREREREIDDPRKAWGMRFVLQRPLPLYIQIPREDRVS